MRSRERDPEPRRERADAAHERLYLAGDAVEAGVYQEVSRGMLIELNSPGELPNLNRPQPSRFERLQVSRRWWNRVADRLCGWMWGTGGVTADDVLLAAGELAPPGVYREVERGIVVDLAQSQPLPDFQTPHPSLYRRIGPVSDVAPQAPDAGERA